METTFKHRRTDLSLLVERWFGGKGEGVLVLETGFVLQLWRNKTNIGSTIFFLQEHYEIKQNSNKAWKFLDVKTTTVNQFSAPHMLPGRPFCIGTP